MTCALDAGHGKKNKQKKEGVLIAYRCDRLSEEFSAWFILETGGNFRLVFVLLINQSKKL